MKNKLPDTNCKNCSAMFSPLFAHHVFCSDECRRKSNPKGRSYFRILERDQFRCIYCGKSSIEDGARLCLDHIIPCAHGGLNVAGNLVTACAECNRHKWARVLDGEVIARIQALVSDRNLQMGISENSDVEMSGQKRN